MRDRITRKHMTNITKLTAEGIGPAIEVHAHIH